MEDTKNTVRREGDRIVKYFGSHMAYVKESSIYEKLKGSGLAPELLEKFDGVIEHAYVEGPSVAEALETALESDRDVETVFSELCTWYLGFRDRIRLTLGGVDFSKFILTDSGLCYLDFEHCKPGYMEEDIADILSKLCFSAGPFSKRSIELVRRFAEMSRARLEWIPDLVLEFLPQCIGEACAEMGYEAESDEILEVLWAVKGNESSESGAP